MAWPRWLHAPDATVLGHGSPETLRSEGRAPGILALHGFGGTPLEVELVMGVARDLRYRAIAPLLAGHGRAVRELAATGFEDWYNAASNALDELIDRGPATVVGFSMGAVVAAQLAARRPGDVRSLVLLSNALWLSWKFAASLDVLAACGAPDLYVPKHASDIADPDGCRTHLTSAAQPLHAAMSLVRAGRATRPLLSQIRVPVCIVHGAYDRVCPRANAYRAAALLTNTVARVVVLPRSRHMITRDYDRSALFNELRAFLREPRLRTGDERQIGSRNGFEPHPRAARTGLERQSA